MLAKRLKLSAHISCSQRSPLIREGVLAHRLDSTSKNPGGLVSKASPCNRHPEFQPLRAWGRKSRREHGRPWQSFAGLIPLAARSAVVAMPAFAQMSVGPVPAPEIGARKIFFMLFLMLGPIKISRSVCRHDARFRSCISATIGDKSDPVFRRRAGARRCARTWDA